MKRVFFAVMAGVLMMTPSFAQYYDNDPIGTVYEYEMSNSLIGSFSVIQTLESVEGNTLRFKVLSDVPGVQDKVEMTNSIVMDGQSIIQTNETAIENIKSSLGAIGKDGDAALEGNTGVIPLNGQVGDTFELSDYTATLNAMGMDVVVSEKASKNEIVREEEVTTPAGTFQCFVVERVSKTQVQAAGVDQTIDTTQHYWVVPGKGVVKMVQTAAGQTFTTELVKITRP
ncbi:MAG: hypothetical protein Q4E10_01560 [Porphyromonas sp.]|nr:hypothetical protein [Porphyromonas sp.]